MKALWWIFVAVLNTLAVLQNVEGFHDMSFGAQILLSANVVAALSATIIVAMSIFEDMSK